MNKKILKTLLITTTSTISVAAITPFLLSCVSNQKKYNFDAQNSSFIVESQALSSSENIFSIFNFFITYNPDNPITNGKFNLLIKNLNEVYQTWFKDDNLAYTKVEFDFKNLSINGWNLVIPTTLLQDNQVKKIINTVIKCPEVSKEQINEWANQNIFNILAPQYFENMTLEQIQNLSSSEISAILTNELPVSTIIWNEKNANNNFATSEIINSNKNTNRTLRILIFIPNIGIGYLNINESENSFKNVEPSPILSELFQGTKLDNNWPTISSTYMKPFNEISNFQNIQTGANSLVNLSYDEAINSESVKNVIDEYLAVDFIKKFNADIDYYLKNYISNIASNWEENSLIFSKVFINKNAELVENKLNAILAIELHNDSTGTKQIKLPITNEIFYVKPNTITSIVIEWKNSNISPFLSLKNSFEKTAYLSTAFNNVTMSVYSNAINTQKTSSTTIEPILKNVFTTNENLYEYSYSLNSIVTNVANGNDLLNSTELLEKSYNSLTNDDLRNVKTNEINNNYLTFLEVFKSVQSIMLKVAKNPTLYDLLKSINTEMYGIIFSLTNDSNIASIVSDIFSQKSLSEYLHTNIENIIDLLKGIQGNSKELKSIVEILETIQNTNPTLEQKREWVKTIVGLFPTLEKLIVGLDWLMPLIGNIMGYISDNDPSIMDLFFGNLDFIFQYLLSSNVDGHLDPKIQELVKSIILYLDTISAFGIKKEAINANPDKYKNLRVLDIVSYEMTTPNKQSSLLFVIADIVSLIDPANTLTATLKGIGVDLGTKYSFPEEIIDYSTAEHQNSVVPILNTITNYKIKEGSEKKVKLTTQLGLVINSLFNIKYSETNSDTTLYDVFANSINSKVITDTFTFDKKQNLLNQDYELSFSLSKDIRIDVLPLSILLDNLHIEGTTTLESPSKPDKNGLVTIKARKLNITVPVVGAIRLGIAELLPRVVNIKKDVNNFNYKYISTNSKLLPSIDNNGNINWQFSQYEEITPSIKTIMQDSNGDQPGVTAKQKNYYGSSYGTLKLAAIALLDLENTWTNFVTTTTNLTNPVKIPNYSGSIYLNNSTFIEKTPNFIEYFRQYIQTNTEWIKNVNNKSSSRFNIKDLNVLTAEIQNYFNIGTLLTQNKYIGYSVGISASKYKLQNENISYTLVINFNVPVLYSSKDVNTGNINTQLVNKITFTI